MKTIKYEGYARMSKNDNTFWIIKIKENKQIVKFKVYEDKDKTEEEIIEKVGEMMYYHEIKIKEKDFDKVFF